MITQKLETVVSRATIAILTGNVLETVPSLVEGSILSSAEIMNKRRLHGSLRDIGLWTGDGAGFYVEDGIPTFYLFKPTDNPIFLNIDEALRQLHDNIHVVIEKEVLNKAYFKASLLELRLEMPGGTYQAHYDVPSEGYDGECTRLQLAVAERVLGEGNDFEPNMHMLQSEGIRLTRIWLPSPDYVTRFASESPIVRPCYLQSFRKFFDFGTGWALGYESDVLCGTLKEPANQLTLLSCPR